MLVKRFLIAALELVVLLALSYGLFLLCADLYKRHNNSQACPDKQIEAFYEKFGTWRGLAIWSRTTW